MASAAASTRTFTPPCEIERVARVAFELARGRKCEVVSAEKGNVMEAGLMWREDVQALRDAEYPDIKLTHMLADNMAMQLVKISQAVRCHPDRQSVRRHAVR